MREVEDWLVGALGAVALTADDLAKWASKGVEQGWRLRDIKTPAGPLTLDLLFDDRFPRSAPRAAWVNVPPFPSIPHVEEDGRFCVLSSNDTIDPRNPTGLVKRVLGAVSEVIEEGFSGQNRDDFKTEFLTYWNPRADGPRLTSLLDPCEPSRSITTWRSKHGILATEGRAAARSWLESAFGKKAVASSQLRRGLMLWLPTPLLPVEYPKNVADLRALATSLGGQDLALLNRLLGRGDQETIIVLGAPAEEGAVFAGITVNRGERAWSRSGFRPGKVPQSIMLLDRGRDKVRRSRVERADGWWVHGRDANVNLTELLTCTVGLMGCGSLGSSVARLLAAAGVGSQLLVDPEKLTRANTGRHILGAGSVDRSKAAALRERLARDFPHLAFDAVSEEWQRAVHRSPQLFERCNLLISTIGGWNDERELNDWHLSGQYVGSVLYGWSEPRGVAGQSVLIGPGSGCLACGMTDHGDPLLTVTRFEHATLRRETACGNYFQPYGAIEIESVAHLVVDLAIDLLLGRASPGAHRLSAAPVRRVDEAGGRLTTAFIELSDGRSRGDNQEERVWQLRPDCSACGGRGA